MGRNRQWYRLLLVLLLSSCIDLDYDGQLFLITKGSHSSNAPIVFTDDNLSFTAMFDSSAAYDLGNEDQLDINKLIGFSIGYNHHINSARIGWRWSIEKNRVELFAYYYLNGARHYKYLCDVKPYQSFSGIIRRSESTLYFVVDNYQLVVDLSMYDLSGGNKGYILFPYFGGNRKAPHDITIVVNVY